jgi:TfoX/Sxy family transcriptional regulator of competence genes
MPYNEPLDTRISDILTKWQNITRKKMFGGVCYLMNGNMLGGVYKNFLIIRLGTENPQNIFKKPYVKAFDITGRPMKGWVMVESKGYEGKKLAHWLEQARDFVATLPEK